MMQGNAGFSRIGIKVSYAVEPGSGHSVGTRPSLEGRGPAVQISFASPASLVYTPFSDGSCENPANRRFFATSGHRRVRDFMDLAFSS